MVEKKIKLIDKWTMAFQFLIKLGRTTNLDILKKIVQYVLVLPGTNSYCERLFSLINAYWTDEKAELLVSTLEASMKVKNLGLTRVWNSVKKSRTIQTYLSDFSILINMINNTYLLLILHYSPSFFHNTNFHKNVYIL